MKAGSLAYFVTEKMTVPSSWAARRLLVCRTFPERGTTEKMSIDNRRGKVACCMTFLDDDLMKREGMYHARRFHDTVWSNSICCLLSKHCLLRLVWFEVESTRIWTTLKIALRFYCPSKTGFSAAVICSRS